MELLGASSEELRDYCEKLGLPAYRGDQLARWIYVRGVSDFAEMTDLPKNLRAQLSVQARITRSNIAAFAESPDGTAKALLELADGNTIECVLLPYEDRLTACISSQVGCAAGCIFCATGSEGFVRNLTPGEIVDQVLTLQGRIGRRITNVVYMGMGEPLFNYSAVLKSIRLLNREVGIAMRHITVSTVGIVPMINKLAEENLQLTLAVSLHAADDETRNLIMPISKKYPLKPLLESCREYASKTGRRVTFEYLLLGRINDSKEDAARLAALLRGILCSVNLIPYNPVEGFDFEKPSKETIADFRRVLEKNAINVTQRLERGHYISAACGQLRRGAKVNARG